jgi:hypothetical protein
MSTRSLLVTSVLLLMASAALAHDLFLKLDTYFLEPHARARITVLNGTFAKSEGFVAPERIADISAVSRGRRTRLPAATTWSRGPDSTSVLSLALGDPGTCVVGVSTRPREIELRAEEFNAYLEGDGIPDILEARRRSNEVAQSAREHYSKHVKAVFQVGTAEVTLDAAGRWYVKFVHMVRGTQRGLDYESKRATLTFEIR